MCGKTCFLTYISSFSRWRRNEFHGMTNHTRIALQQELAQTAKQAARESTQWPTRKTGPKTSPYESFLLMTKYKSIMGNSKKPEGSGGKGEKKKC